MAQGTAAHGPIPNGTALARQGAMWLEAILTKEDLRTVLRQFSPLAIRLGDTGSLLLAEPTDVFVIADEGIGVVCDATLHWPVLGFDVPLSFKGLTVRVLPLVDTAAAGTPLVFRLQMDHAGVAILPELFDHRITTMVNDELQKKHVELSWNFIQTLSHEFELPAAISSAAAVSLVAKAGLVKANDAALGLAVRFETTVRPRTGAEQTAPETAREGEQRPHDAVASNASPRENPVPLRAMAHATEPGGFDARAFVVGASVATMAFAVVSGIAGLVRGGRRSSW